LNKHLDSWNNAVTGLGHAMRDKITHTEFSASHVLSDETLEALYHGDDIAARVCELLPDEMLRQGFEIQSDDADAINNELTRLGAREKLGEALVWSRVYGGAALFLGVDDGQSQALPLKLESVRSLKFLTVLEKRELQPTTYYRDPLEPQFGQVETYRVSNNEIHESRLLLFHGTRTSKQRRSVNGGWSHSVLQRMYDVMRQFNMSWQSAAHLMTDAAQAVFKLKGLHAQIAANKTSEILQRMELVDMSRSVARAVLLDAEDEDFKRDTYSFSGIPDLLDKFTVRLAAAARMPVSLLMGQAPAGLNATGDSDIRFFYDQVKAAQEHTLRPALERLVTLILASKGQPRFTVSFPALWQETEREKAELRKIQAEIDSTYIQQGVLLPEEVALNRFRISGYSTETSISIDARQAIIDDDLSSQLQPNTTGDKVPVVRNKFSDSLLEK
jgi:phage-related protein (TIGR01555 family)